MHLSHTNAALATIAAASLLVLTAWPRPADLSIARLLRPIELHKPIPAPNHGYVLEEVRPGPDNDAVLEIRGARGGVEMHILNRGTWSDAWDGIATTPSFDIGWEVYGTSAPLEDCTALRDAIATALRANDSGGLHLEDLSRHAAASSVLERTLDRLRGPRGIITSLLLVTIASTLSLVPFGTLALVMLLATLGLWLRATQIDLPIAIDGEIQRVFTGHLPLLDAIRFSTTNERHPPMLFVLLHAVQIFGQSEAIVRLPALLSGTITGPAIFAVAMWLQRPSSPSSRIAVTTTAFCAGLIACATPELVYRSREVSELTLFSLIAIVTLGTSIKACQRDGHNIAQLIVVATGHALLLWTYYMAPFLIIGFWLALRAYGPVSRQPLLAAAIGCAAGLPSLAFGAFNLVLDLPIRETANDFPRFLWGDQRMAAIAYAVIESIPAVFSRPLAALLVAVALIAVAHRLRAVVALLAGVAAVGVGMTVLVPTARIQAYYFVSVLPLLPLALALFPVSESPARQALATAAFVIATAITVPSGLAMDVDRIYTAHPQSSRRFAQLIAAAEETDVAVFMPGYERRVAYSLALGAGIEIDWRDLPLRHNSAQIRGLRQRFVPLLQVEDKYSSDVALASLESLADQKTFLAILPHPSHMPKVDIWLQRCSEIDRVESQRLLRCPSRSAK